MPQRIMLRRNGPPSVLQLEEFDISEPGPGEVQVGVERAGINFADLVMRIGFYRDAPPLPFVPGYEVAGKVLAVGEGVTGIKRGQSVAATTQFGGYTSHINITADNVFAHPKSISVEEAAAFPVQWLTAWCALHDSARVREGERVLVHGGAGGVGMAAIALAHAAGCEVHATVGGPEKVDFLEKHTDVTHAYDYTAAPWHEQVPGNYDVVLDSVGGEHLKQSIRAIRPGGKVVAFGASDTTTPRRSLVRGVKMLRAMRMSTIPLLMNSKSLMGLNLLRLWQTGYDLRPAAEEILRGMVSKRIPKPYVDVVFPAERAAEAHQYIHDRKSRGKVLLGF